MSAPPIVDVQLTSGPVTSQAWQPFPQPAGAECAFLGRTRAETHSKHGALTKLTYQAYEPMARHVLETLAHEAITTYGCLAVRLHHAVGDVGIGEASVLVNVVCGHRDKAFQACRFLIDALKQHAPIWKQEVWADGTTWSEGAPAQHARNHTP